MNDKKLFAALFAAVVLIFFVSGFVHAEPETTEPATTIPVTTQPTVITTQPTTRSTQPTTMTTTQPTTRPTQPTSQPHTVKPTTRPTQPITQRPTTHTTTRTTGYYTRPTYTTLPPTPSMPSYESTTDTSTQPAGTVTEPTKETEGNQKQKRTLLSRIIDDKMWIPILLIIISLAVLFYVNFVIYKRTNENENRLVRGKYNPKGGTKRKQSDIKYGKYRRK